MPRLTFQENQFVFKCSFQDRELARKAGFRWDYNTKIWYTPRPEDAARLQEFADDRARSEINRVMIMHVVAPFELSTPKKGKLLPHQIEAIKFALGQNRCYLGLDPGLGKTIIAARVVHELERNECLGGAVYICPPFLVKNVISEFVIWAPNTNALRFLIVPDSMLTKQTVRESIERMASIKPSLLLIDEAHRYKSELAQRTQALFGDVKKDIVGIVDWFDRVIFMSGTPMPNRPIELYPVLSKMAPQTIDFMSKFDFGRRYCAGYRNNWGWDFSGASNVPELSRRVIHPTGPFMLRQKKELLNLPPKLEEVFVISDSMSPKLTDMDSKIAKGYDASKDAIVQKLAQIANTEELHLATYRRLLGTEKVGPAVEYIKALLEETDENLLVFAYHKEVIRELKLRLSAHSPFVITGETPVDKRQEMVNEFQTSKTARLFIGNYLAMGVGFTLTRATRVIFVEFDWVPGNNDQASDRAHRIGQNNSVLVQYMVYENSIDKAVIETILRKRKSIEHL